MCKPSMIKMDNIFEKAIYRIDVSPNRKELIEAWNTHAGSWLDELTGGIMPNVEGCSYKVYHRFDELSGEEQYDFACWWKENGERVEREWTKKFS